MWHIQTLPAFPFTSAPPKPPPPSPPLPWAPLQPAACLWRSPLTSAARLGSVPALWALDGCGWSEKQSGVCGSPVCVEHTAQARLVLLKRIKWPVNSRQARCPALSPVHHTHQLLNETREDEGFVLRAAQDNKCSPRRPPPPPQIWLLYGLSQSGR